MAKWNQPETMLGEALVNPADGYRRLGRVGFYFGRPTLWERIKIRFWALLHNERRLQIAILDSLRKANMRKGH